MEYMIEYAENMNRALVEQIRDVLKQTDTVLFVGAGLSRWSGLPNWPELVEELAKFIEEQGESAELVRRELKAGDLLQAASFGVDKLTKTQFAQFIRKATRFGQARPHVAHQKLVNLGPTCFITTNFDQLLEESLRLWHQDRFFRTISNRQVTETADIVQARATGFVFKPHGDVADSESLVLSREQYRSLIFQRRHVIDAVKTLLVSRPVVFLGFGLRDPDFIYVKDLIFDTYQGGSRDHYAIMPNVSYEEEGYWRRNYGVHILSYDAPNQDHTRFLACLEAISTGEVTTKTEFVVQEGTQPFSESQILSITRYCDKLVLTAPEAAEELPLQVSLKEEVYQSKEWSPFTRFHKASIQKLLCDFDINFLLSGNPGAGKTYALRKFCAGLAGKVSHACLQEPDKLLRMQVTLPIYIDLKLYDGNLWNGVQRSLPPEIDLAMVIQNMKVKFVLDSFNELPREYLEGGFFDGDLSDFLNKIGSHTVIIASRTSDGLSRLHLPEFVLDEIDHNFVENALRNRGYEIAGEFKQEIISLLQKPLFYQLVCEGKVYLKELKRPREVYASLFQVLTNNFKKEVSLQLEFDGILSALSYGLIEEGVEAVALKDILDETRRFFNANNITNIDELDIVNWLIGQGVLVPIPESRVIFFHQSITEYLAALELAKLYIVSPAILKRCLRNTRWDQTLFLTIEFLNEQQAARFIEEVLFTEFNLAIKAAKYVEMGRDTIVSHILEAMLQKSFDNFFEAISTSHLVRELPVSDVHVKYIRQLVKQGGILGGEGAMLLGEVLGSKSLEELFSEMSYRGDDYNFCNRVGQTIARIVSDKDLAYVISRLISAVRISDEKEHDGLVEGFAVILKQFSVAELVGALPSLNKMGELEVEVLCSSLRESKDDEAVKLLLSLIRSGLRNAVFPFYMKLKHNQGLGQLDAKLIDTELINILVNWFSVEDLGEWAMDSVKLICRARPDLADIVRQLSSNATGILKVALLYCIIEEEKDEFWHEMCMISEIDQYLVGDVPFHLLGELDELDWRDHTDILLSLLRLKNTQLARSILDSFFSLEPASFSLNLEPIEWWLEWMQEESRIEEGYWFVSRLAAFLGTYCDKSTHMAIIKVFNESSDFRALLAHYVLHKIPDLSTDQLGDKAIEFLISDLREPMARIADSRLIGDIATESFVNKYLLPLLDLKEEPLKSNLRSALKAAGARHKRRYFSEQAN